MGPGRLLLVGRVSSLCHFIVTVTPLTFGAPFRSKRCKMSMSASNGLRHADWRLSLVQRACLQEVLTPPAGAEPTAFTLSPGSRLGLPSRARFAGFTISGFTIRRNITGDIQDAVNI